MADQYDKYRKPQGDPYAKYRRQSNGPGDTPDNIIDKQHPELGDDVRRKLYYASPTTEALRQNLEKHGFEAVAKPDGNVAIRRPGGKWHAFDESGLSLKDVTTDIIGDVQDLWAGAKGATAGGSLGAAGGTAVAPGVGTAVGGFLGGVGGFGAGYGASRAARGLIGSATGNNQADQIETLKGAGEGFLEGAATEVGGRALGAGVRLAGRGLKSLAGKSMEATGKALQVPEKFARRNTGEEAMAGLKAETDAARVRMSEEVNKPWREMGREKRAWEAKGKEVHAPVAQAELKAAEAYAQAEAEGAAAREAAKGKVEEALNRLAKEVPGVRAALQTSVKPPVPGEAAAGGGKALYRNFSKNFTGEEMDALLPHKILAKYLRVMPEWQVGFKKIWGDGFYSDLASADMKGREEFFRKLIDTIGPDDFLNRAEASKAFIADEILNNPAVNLMKASAAKVNALRRIRMMQAAPEDAKLLNETIEDYIKARGVPAYVTAAEKELSEAGLKQKAWEADRAIARAGNARRVEANRNTKDDLQNLIESLTNKKRLTPPAEPRGILTSKLLAKPLYGSGKYLERKGLEFQGKSVGDWRFLQSKGKPAFRKPIQAIIDSLGDDDYGAYEKALRRLMMMPNAKALLGQE